MVETRHGTVVSRPDEPATKDVGVAGTSSAGVTASAGRGSTPLPAAQMYILLAAALAGFSLPLFFMPKLAAKFVFGSAAEPADDQHKHLLQLNGGALLAAAATALGLEEAARKHMLHTFTADTLKLGLASFAAGNLLLAFYYPATPTAIAGLLALVGNAAMVALPASQLLLSANDRNRVARDFRNLPRNVGSFFAMRRPSVTSALYTLLTVMFPLAGAAYFVMPKFTLYHTFGYVYGKSTQYLWKMAGVADMTLMPAIVATLKDKAENDLLGRSIARTLNLGLMGASLLHLLVLGPILSIGHGGWMLPLLISTWGMAMLTSMLGLASKNLAELAEQTAEAAKVE